MAVRSAECYFTPLCRGLMNEIMAMKSSKRGFTLVEVLVSLVILSLLMLSTVAAMRAFGKTQVALEEATYRSDEVRMVSRFIRNSLEVMLGSSTGATAKLSTGGGPSTDGTGYFEGERSKLSWHAPMIFGENFGGALALQLAKEENNLVLRWQNIKSAGSDYEWNNSSSRILLENVDSLEVQYRSGFAEEWADTWKAAEGSPMTVRMELKVLGRYWPELIIGL